MNKTEAHQIHPALEKLHSEAKQIKTKELDLEEENAELRRALQDYEDIQGNYEGKIGRMLQDGTLHLSEADV